MAINQLTEIRLADGRTIGLAEWSSRPLYSTADLLSGYSDEEIRLFSYVEGREVTASGNMPAAAVRTATEKETNISSPNELAATEEYLVYDIACEYFQLQLNQAQDGFDSLVGGPMPFVSVLSTVFARLVLELEVSDKSFPQAGLGWFGTGFGVEPYVALPSAAPLAAYRTYANASLPSKEALQPLELPVHIGGTEEYNVILHNYDGNGVDFPDDAGALPADPYVLVVRTYLCGLHKRGTK